MWRVARTASLSLQGDRSVSSSRVPTVFLCLSARPLTHERCTALVFGARCVFGCPSAEVRCMTDGAVFESQHD